MDAKMFCYQCQETAGGKGCTVQGVCGKKPDVAEMQDLLVYVTKGLGAVTTALRAAGKPVSVETNHRVTMNLFITITNANFDLEAIKDAVEESLALKAELLAQLGDASSLPEAAHWTAARADFAAKAKTVGILATKNEDVRSLRELTTYGLKGLAAYVEHANALGFENEEIDAFSQRALAQLLDDSLDGSALTALVLETGKWGVAGMALLDTANTSSYGNPEISKVKLGVRNRPGILISGHDLKDLERLLEQTKGTGVDVYTHRNSSSTTTSSATTATRGGSRKRSSRSSTARSS